MSRFTTLHDSSPLPRIYLNFHSCRKYRKRSGKNTARIANNALIELFDVFYHHDSIESEKKKFQFIDLPQSCRMYNKNKKMR